MRRSGAASALWVASALLAVLLLPTGTADAAALSAAVHGYATVHLDAAGGVRVERVDRPGARRQVRSAQPRDRYTSDLSRLARCLAPSIFRSYFYNSVTGESSWERPAPLSWVAAERGWWSNNVTSATSTTEPEAFGHLSADGKRYWVVNGEATWTAPKVRDARAPRGY